VVCKNSEVIFWGTWAVGYTVEGGGEGRGGPPTLPTPSCPIHPTGDTHEVAAANNTWRKQLGGGEKQVSE
jgi:hypothetical protein